MRKINATVSFLLIGTLWILSACGDSTREQAKKSAGATQPKTESVNPDEKPDYLIEQKVFHAFSDPAKKDAFRITITGKSLLEGKVLFTITSSEGINLLREEFDADYLLGYEFTGNIHAQKETDAFIAKRIREFFSEDNFSVPAIKDNEVFEDQSYYIDKETWEEIKANKQSIGFYYLLGKEDGRHIAFSKKKGKVVMVYNCC